MDHLNMTSKNYLEAETTSKNSRRDDEKRRLAGGESVVGGWGKPGAGYIVLAYSVLFSKKSKSKVLKIKICLKATFCFVCNHFDILIKFMPN